MTNSKVRSLSRFYATEEHSILIYRSKGYGMYTWGDRPPESLNTLVSNNIGRHIHIEHEVSGTYINQ